MIKNGYHIKFICPDCKEKVEPEWDEDLGNNQIEVVGHCLNDKCGKDWRYRIHLGTMSLLDVQRFFFG